MTRVYKDKEEILIKAHTLKDKSLREVLSPEIIEKNERSIYGYNSKRKGQLGNIIEEDFFDINPGNKCEPDFSPIGIELKTTPIKNHKEKKYVSKERLVFSMINYKTIINESWTSSSFLKKNKSLLLLFYLWVKGVNILDYKFKYIYLLNLLEDISDEDVLQIQKDWEYIVAKIRRNEAHLLSEGDTYYLGACTKAANSNQVREQGSGDISAKPRAFSLKQQYVNYLIQTKLLGRTQGANSIFRIHKKETIEEAVYSIFLMFLGKTDKEILKILGSKLEQRAKNYKRLIVDRIFKANTSKLIEFEKANITLRVITLEHTGTLKESISFPSFDYTDLLTQVWYDENLGMSDFHLQLESKKFLFVVFQKKKKVKDLILKKILFWNFPMTDISEAEKVWQKTLNCINNGNYEDLPKIADSPVAHVRPHARNGNDKIITPQGTFEVKRCFWLNAKYIQRAIENA